MSSLEESSPAATRANRRASSLQGSRVVLGIVALIIALTAGAVIAPTMALREPEPELDVYGQVPAFELLDQTGAAISDRDLRGKVVIVNTVFTRCITVCPVFTMKMRRVQKRTADVANDLKLVSFTVDPEHDTPEVLAEYAAKHHADPSRWRFVTGAPEAVRKVLADGFAVAMDPMGTQPDGTPNIVHAEHFILVDRDGKIRGYYNSNDANRVERMLRDARRLINDG